MDIQNDIRQQRWAMLTNPFALPVPPMCRVTEIEVIEHLMMLDVVCEGKQYSHERMKEYRARFVRFCEIQWNCRDRN